MPAIDISTLAQTLNKTHKTIHFHLTNGEPLLVPNIIEVCQEITKRHLVSLSTNLTQKNIRKFVQQINPERVLFITATLHIKELERLNLVERYVHHLLLCQEKGFRIHTSIVAHPPLVDKVEHYRKFFQKQGIQLNFTPFFGEYNGKIYPPEAYTEKEMEIFGFEKSYLNMYKQHGKLCNAGYNVGLIRQNGDIRPCSKIRKPIGHIYEETMQLNKQLIRCPFQWCECPLNVFDPYLFEKALQEAGSYVVNPLLLLKDVMREYLKRGFLRYLTYNKRIQILNFVRRLGLKNITD